MKILIAAGGSGGHIFPAVALAEELKGKEPLAEILFVGSDKDLDRRIFEKLINLGAKVWREKE